VQSLRLHFFYAKTVSYFCDMHFSVNQEICLQLKDVSLYVKREDLLCPEISGNKFRKLKYNLLEIQRGYSTLLTFGGAFSNHIAATSAAGKKFGFKTIGVIRGDELELQAHLNPTLQFALENGMTLEFVSREVYRDGVNNNELLCKLRAKYGDFYLLPEGGTNALAVKGCEEILTEQDKTFDYLCCAVGTGGTIAGIINASAAGQSVIGFPALKGSFLNDDIRKFAKKENWELIPDYSFGGYGKVNDELVRFLNYFYEMTHIPLDPVYTGKMMFGVLDLIDKGYFKRGSRILCIHTGGLQGIAGINKMLKKKQKLQIVY